MKRLTDEEIRNAIASMSQPHGHPAVLIRVTEHQLQADKEAIKESRENIIYALRSWRSAILAGTSNTANEFADQIIKILEEE